MGEERGNLVPSKIFFWLRLAVQSMHTIRYRGEGKVCFLPPLFCPTKFVKSSVQCVEKKARRRRKNFEVPFLKKLTFLGKFNGF